MYYDLLARIKNASRARKENVLAPFSRFDFEVAKLLANEGFVRGAEKRTVGKRPMLEIKLKYDSDQRPILTDFKIVSRPSRRFYAGYRELRAVRQNYGLSVLSTPEGIVTNRQARKQKVGGEYLFEIW